MKLDFSDIFSEKGQSLPEYALVVALMSVIVIAVFILLGPQIYDAVHNAVDEETAGEAERQLEESLEEQEE